MQQAGKQVLAVLPYRFDHHQRRIGGNGAEDLDAPLLAVDEAMLLHRIKIMPTAHFMALGADCRRHGCFDFGLHRPAFLIGREP